MYTIFKVKLEPRDIQPIHVKPGAEILYAREQGDDMCLWYRFKEEIYPMPTADATPPESATASIDKRWIRVCGTGHECPPPDKARYLGSAHVQGGRYIWHIFELTDVK